MAGQSKNQPPCTAYGTSSLDTEPSLDTSRPSHMKWGATALTLTALGYYVLYTGVATSEITAPSPLGTIEFWKKAKISAWQSSYLDGETKMMEPLKLSKHKKSRSSSSQLSSFIRVDASIQYQGILGFGGVFTEAAAIQFAKLPRDKQEEVLTLYFDKKKGSGYEFGRIPMNSCDFSPSSYNFDSVANDTTLKFFDMNVTHDTKLLIPFVQRALQKNPNMRLFLSPWSPPEWMKLPTFDEMQTMTGSARPECLDPKFREAWALYFSKYITAYKQHGIPFWGLTPQNEPEAAADWEACLFTPSAQADFVGNYLGPILERDHPEVKIIVFDYVRATMLQWAEVLFKDPHAEKYVDGIAVHWYGSGTDAHLLMDGVEFHKKLDDTHQVDPTRFILSTEAANCPDVATGDLAWFRGQRYAHDIINDFNNWVVGWVDWNLLLDHTGGPNHLGNNCDAPIIVDETEEDYFIQHFSKYVPAGSRRIYSEVAVAFANPGEAQLLERYPVELRTCDNSARQLIELTATGQLEVTGTGFCFDLVDPVLREKVISIIPKHQLMVMRCEETSSRTWTWAENGQLRTDGDDGSFCLALHHGSTEDGVDVSSASCVENEIADSGQSWQFIDGKLRSTLSSKCVTAGYSFVQSVAFVTPENQKVLVIVNENTEDTEFELQFEGQTLDASIPRGAIQTYVWGA